MRLRTLVVALGIAATGAQAQEAGLGRLFYTPQERAALENARRKNIRAETLAAEASAKPKVPRSRNVEVSGVITRSDGETVVWVNGKPVDGETADGMLVTTLGGGQGSVVLHEPERRRSVRVKVGQRADLLTGRVEENYANRQRAAVTTPVGEDGADAEPTEDVAEPRVPPANRRKTRNRNDDEPVDAGGGKSQ